VTYTGQPGNVDCAIVIVTYNSARDISGLLDSLPAAAAGLRLRVVVVDNGSADGTADLIRARSDVLCVQAGANLGYAGGINLGRRHAGEYAALAVLNPDLALAPGALREMFAVLEDPAVGVVVPMLLGLDGSCYPSLRRKPTLARAIGDGLLGDHLGSRPGWLSEIVRGAREYGYRHAVEWATGAAMLISAACDRAVGPWDERFFLYSEEVDYATRARTAGFRIEYTPAARARHRGAGSGQSSALTALMAVNRVRYIEKQDRHPRAYRAVVFAHELLRAADPNHRAAMRAVSRRSRWMPLLTQLRGPATNTRVPRVKA
jgi:GT2 family glycosyltransferase